MLSDRPRYKLGCRDVLAGKVLAASGVRDIRKQVREDWWIQDWTGNDMALLLKGVSLKKSMLKFLIEKLENNTGNVEKQGKDSLYIAFYDLFPYNVFCFYSIYSMNRIHCCHKYSLNMLLFKNWVMLILVKKILHITEEEKESVC